MSGAEQWRQLPDGARTWARFPGASWRYDPSSGDISAVTVDGTPIDTSSKNRLTSANTLVSKYAPDLTRVCNGDRFYIRGLLALGTIECPPGTLPCYGDCWKKDAEGKKQIAKCGSEGASPPDAVGLYQVTHAAAADVDVPWSSLETSPEANHVAAYRVAKKQEPRTGKDFPTLAAIWQAGGVYPASTFEWGVRTFRSNTLTLYVQGWNAVGQVFQQKGWPAASSSAPSSSGSSSGFDVLAGIGLLTWAINGFKIGRIFR